MRLLSLLITLAAPAFAAADDDVVLLRDHTVLRGHAVEISPERDVLMRLETGEVRRLGAAEILDAHGELFDRAFGPTWTRPGPERAAVEVSADASGATRVGYRESLPTARGRLAHGPYLELCQLPCRVYLPPGYRELTVDGEGYERAAFGVSVPDSGGRLALHLETPSHERARLGLVIAGGIGTVVGALTILFGWLPPRGAASDTPPNVAAMATGGALAGVSLALVTSGAVLARGRSRARWR